MSRFRLRACRIDEIAAPGRHVWIARWQNRASITVVHEFTARRGMEAPYFQPIRQGFQQGSQISHLAALRPSDQRVPNALATKTVELPGERPHPRQWPDQDRDLRHGMAIVVRTGGRSHHRRARQAGPDNRTHRINLDTRTGRETDRQHHAGCR